MRAHPISAGRSDHGLYSWSCTTLYWRATAGSGDRSETHRWNKQVTGISALPATTAGPHRDLPGGATVPVRRAEIQVVGFATSLIHGREISATTKLLLSFITLSP